MSSKRECSPVDREYWRVRLPFPHLTRLVLPSLPSCAIVALPFPAQLWLTRGAEGNFRDENWALDHVIPVRELSDPPTIYALDGRILSKILRATAPVSLTISGNHQETISFFIICSPLSPIDLGHHWLT